MASDKGVAAALDLSRVRREAIMVDIKGSSIAPETFRVEGHCCGIRIPALMDQGSAGVQFEMSPEVRAELLKAGIRPAADPQESPQDYEQGQGKRAGRPTR